MPERRFPPPGLQHPATGTPVKPGSAHALLTLARRFAETPAVRAMVAVLAVAAVAILAGWRGCGCSENRHPTALSKDRFGFRF